MDIRASKPVVWVGLAILAAAVLRLLWVGDMEYKLDEQYMFLRLLGRHSGEPWPWLGMPSGVQLRNPGMSVWIFLALGKLAGATRPEGLARAVQMFNTSAIALAAVFAWRLVPRAEREPWLWAVALAAVNPIAVMYQRKIWAQSVLPFFMVLLLAAWWRRERRAGAFFWGLLAACVGQIHMSGFFFAAGILLWTLCWERPRLTHWRYWFLGAFVGALPLLPWIVHLLSGSAHSAAGHGWDEAVQLKFWVFWLTDPFGLHVGNALGVLRGNSTLAQLGDFLRYPLLGTQANSQATYGMAVVHLLLAGLLLCVLTLTTRGLWRRRRDWKNLIVGATPTAFAQNAAFFSYGTLLTVSTVMIRRYYMLVTFPLEFVWVARQFLQNMARRPARALLTLLVVCEFLVSLGLLGYIHVNGGAIYGDYGTAYRLRSP